MSYRPCRCYSNPDCALCGGKGFLTEEDVPTVSRAAVSANQKFIKEKSYGIATTKLRLQGKIIGLPVATFKMFEKHINEIESDDIESVLTLKGLETQIDDEITKYKNLIWNGNPPVYTKRNPKIKKKAKQKAKGKNKSKAQLKVGKQKTATSNKSNQEQKKTSESRAPQHNNIGMVGIKLMEAFKQTGRPKASGNK